MTVKLLGIETATEACSAALYLDGEIVERYEVAPRKHNELILTMCEQVLAEAEVALTSIDALAFGCGPGAFTGLRIAASVTQAISLAHDLPVASISTLANLAQQIKMQTGERVLTAIDARMDEIYWAIYEKNQQNSLDLIVEECVQASNSIEAQQMEKVNYGWGTGWQTYKDDLASKSKLEAQAINGQALPRASTTVELGAIKYRDNDMVDAVNVLPVYLRNQVVQKKA